MRFTKALALAGVSLAAFSTAAAAQPTAASSEEAMLGEIVVTARRQSESLQNVPQTVNAITADTLQKLNITTFQDIQVVVPGLSLQQGNSAFGASASLRGISQSAIVNPNPTVAIYLNDAQAIPVEAFQSLFDIGQIEVLKGPQGTTRGASAPSGAITITTRKPHLSEFGGYLSALATDHRSRNAQGALNIPIIEDVLAARLAGSVDQTDFDGVRSINSPLRPRAVSTAGRFSLSFEPNDLFNANLTYQHLDRDQQGFQQVAGPGNRYNPPISASQRVAVQDRPTTFSQHFDTVVAQVDSRVFGHRLSYVGSYHFMKLKQNEEADAGNILPGSSLFTSTFSTAEQTSQELRLTSEPAPRRMIDYTVGVYYAWAETTARLAQSGPLQLGAFGPPGSPPNLAALNPAYMIPLNIDGPGTIQETSVFGNVTLHLGSKTEVSAGLRHIAAISGKQLGITLGAGQIALPATLFGGQCAASTYAGFCDMALPTAGTVVSNTRNRSSETPTIYNVAISHRLTPDLLIYANTGSSYRGPATKTGINGALATSTDPVLRTLSFQPSEKSHAYEAGFKATFLEGRARLNFALYRQKFDNLTIAVPGITYLNTVTGQPAQLDFTASVDAIVQGADAEAAWQINPNWNLAVQASYNHSKIDGSPVPCNLTGAGGAPVFNTYGLISLCPGGSASQLPLWNLTAQTEYIRPVADRIDGFIRGILNYYPENKNVQPNFTAPNYSLVNLYAGVRSPNGAWEASLFARNAFGTDKLLDRSQQPINTLAGSLAGSFPGLNIPSGYNRVLSYTPRREVGLSIRYAWGSR